MNDRRVSTLWIMLLTAASLATSLVFACATPFPALAALAATRMRRGDALWLTAAAWGVSQAVGFCILDYPTDAMTLARGGAIGASALAATLVACRAAKQLRGAPALIVAFVAASAGFKLALFGFAFVLPGMTAGFTVSVMATQLVRNALILAGLVALYHGLRAAGVPHPKARRRVAVALC